MEQHQQKFLFFGVLFFLLYALFWVYIFDAPFFKKSQSVSPVSKSGGLEERIISKKIETLQEVLSESVSPIPQLPQAYNISLIPRRQVFNLSCEFAAAASIVYHFTNDARFSPLNELEAEKILLSHVATSQNPNVGVRMGEESLDTSNLYSNLNQRFGGSVYYGVHAPPFFDVFAKYGLLAVPLYNNEQTIPLIQKAVSLGHLVMTWIRIGYGQSIDVALSYGATIAVVAGEHVVVIHGYDQKGVFVMDPGSGTNRHVAYDVLVAATNPFALPYLEVYPSSADSSFFEVVDTVNKTTGLLRQNLQVTVENANGQVGIANKAATILQEFGYHLKEVKNAEIVEYEGIRILLKATRRDYLHLLEKDLQLATYRIASASATLDESYPTDVVIMVGQ